MWGIDSVKHVKYINKQYVFETPLRFNDEYSLGNITKCDLILMEDSKSGYQIFRHYFQVNGKMDVKNSEGNGNIPKKLLEFGEDHDIIVGLDYDKGSWALYYIKTLIDSKQLNKNKIYFIRMEAVEEVICNSELILSKCPEMKDFVENIENHIDCSIKHRGDYFMLLLKMFFISKNGSSLYAKNNTSCFRRECKDCEVSQCKFREDIQPKVKMLFSNKYKILYELYTYLTQA